MGETLRAAYGGGCGYVGVGAIASLVAVVVGISRVLHQLQYPATQ